MSGAQIYKATVTEDTDCYVMARLYKKNSSHDLVVVASSDFSTISRTVKQAGTTITGPTSLTPGNVILSALSTGTVWDVDTTGFNFIDLVPASAFPSGGVTYRIEYTYTMTSGTVFILPIDATTLEVVTS